MRPTLSLSLLCLLWAFFPSINHFGVIAIPTPPVPALHGPELLPRLLRSKAGLENAPIVLSRGRWRNDENINIQSDEKWTIFIDSAAFRLEDHQITCKTQKQPSKGSTLIGHATFADDVHKLKALEAMTQVQGAQTNLIYIVYVLAKLEQTAEKVELNEKYYDVMRQMFHAKGTTEGGPISDDETITKIYESIEHKLEINCQNSPRRS
ncbi:hypothetical protein GGU11DRAFT_761341 [Lentinula aff. detonsa]|nr:hypothetical protein GGU11DRAFT_761341 [Lentinula aff. detonsa]